MVSIDEAIEKYKEITSTEAICPGHCNISCDKCLQESKQIVKWLEKLKTIESIMLTYNANWYADEDNGVPDCEVLESIWNVIQDNGLDIDIEQDYRKGKADGYNKAIDDFAEKAKAECREHYVDCDGYFGGIKESILHEDDIDEILEQLKAGGENGKKKYIELS